VNSNGVLVITRGKSYRIFEFQSERFHGLGWGFVKYCEELIQE